MVAVVLTVLVASAFAARAATVQHAGAATPTFDRGAVADITWGTSRADTDRTVAAMRDAGVQWVRANVNWADVEKTKGSLDSWWLTEIDYAVAAARSAGMQVLMPFSDGVPYWASADPGKYSDGGGQHWNKYWKPSSFADYANFAKTMVTRYQAQGVHAFEVWNEPNYVRFWPSGPSGSDYAAMLQAVYPAIKAADPTATVVSGGLSTNDYSFVDALYQAGAGPNFDALALHPYSGATDPNTCWDDPGTSTPAKNAFCGIESVRRVMVANGDTAKTVWLTELGWSTSTALPGVSEATQADFLTKAFTKLREYPYVKTAFWYSVRNLFWAHDDPSDVENGYGLVRTDFSQKPSFSAYTAFTG